MPNKSTQLKTTPGSLHTGYKIKSSRMHFFNKAKDDTVTGSRGNVMFPLGLALAPAAQPMFGTKYCRHDRRNQFNMCMN